MGTSITFIMLRVTSSIILLGAVATRAAPNPVNPILPKTSALDFMRNPASVGDEEEMPEIPEDVPVPNCSPSAALLKIGQWRYVPNNGVSNTADVWFTVLPKMLTYQAGAAACQALDKNIQMASIMNSGENTAIKGMHGNGEKVLLKLGLVVIMTVLVASFTGVMVVRILMKLWATRVGTRAKVIRVTTLVRGAGPT